MVYSLCLYCSYILVESASKEARAHAPTMRSGDLYGLARDHSRNAARRGLATTAAAVLLALAACVLPCRAAFPTGVIAPDRVDALVGAASEDVARWKETLTSARDELVSAGANKPETCGRAQTAFGASLRELLGEMVDKSVQIVSDNACSGGAAEQGCLAPPPSVGNALILAGCSQLLS